MEQGSHGDGQCVQWIKERQEALEQDMEIVRGNVQKHDDILATHDRLKTLEDNQHQLPRLSMIETETLVGSKIDAAMKEDRMKKQREANLIVDDESPEEDVTKRIEFYTIWEELQIFGIA